MLRSAFLKRMALAAAACAFLDVPWPEVVDGGYARVGAVTVDDRHGSVGVELDIPTGEYVVTHVVFGDHIIPL